MHRNLIPASILILCLLIALRLNAQQMSVSDDSAWRSILTIESDSLRDVATGRFWDQRKNTDPELVKKLALERLRQARKTGDLRGIVGSYYILAQVYNITDDVTQSLKYTHEGIEYARKAKDTVRWIGLLENYGNISMNGNDMNRAYQIYQEALALAERTRSPYQQAMVLNSLGIAYARTGKHQEAIGYYRKALGLVQDDPVGQKAYMMYVNLAIAYKNAGRFQEALNEYYRAEKMIDSLGFDYEKMIVIDNMANLFLEMNRLSEAERFGDSAVRLSYTLNDRYVRADMYEMFTRLHEKRQEYTETIRYLRELALLKDTLLNEEKTRQVHDLEIRYDTKMKDRQIVAQKARLAVNRKINFFLGLSLCFLLLIGIISYAGWRRSRRLYLQIAIQKKQMEELNGVKDRLFAAISHDMRTPVNSLISFTLLLENAGLTQEKLRSYTHELKNMLAQTARLMDNLLNFAKSQISGSKLQIAPVDVSETIQDVISLLASEAGYKELAIDNRIVPGTMVSADSNMLALVLRNVLSNSIKFSHRGGKINVSSLRLEKTMLITVTDSGVGMTEEAAKAFNSAKGEDRFETHPGTAGEKGSGMGLFLCRRFVSLMHGNIRVDTDLGRGCSFIIELPAA